MLGGRANAVFAQGKFLDGENVRRYAGYDPNRALGFCKIVFTCIFLRVLAWLIPEIYKGNVPTLGATSKTGRKASPLSRPKEMLHLNSLDS